VRPATSSLRGVALGAGGLALLLASGAAGAQDHAAHVGSFKTEAEARAAWTRIKSQNAEAFGGREARLVETDVPGRGVWVRVLIAVSDRAEANRLCQSLKSSNQYCVPMTGAFGTGRPPPAAPAAAPKPAPAPPMAAAPIPAPAPAATLPAPTSPPKPAPRPATQAPEPIAPAIVVPTAPLEAARPSTAVDYHGAWARRLSDCRYRDIVFAPARMIYRDPSGTQDMSCKFEVSAGQMSVSCEDDSRALFDLRGRDEIQLRWTKSAAAETPIASGATWRRCAEEPK